MQVIIVQYNKRIILPAARNFGMVTSASEVKKVYPEEKLLEYILRGQVWKHVPVSMETQIIVNNSLQSVGEYSKGYMTLVLYLKG